MRHPQPSASDVAFVTSWRESEPVAESYKEALADLKPALANTGYTLTGHDGERMTFARRYRPRALIVAAVLLIALAVVTNLSTGEAPPVAQVVVTWAVIVAAIVYKRRNELVVTVRAVGDSQSEVTVAGHATASAAQAVVWAKRNATSEPSNA